MTTVNCRIEAILTVKAEAQGTVIANFALQHMKAAVTFRDHVVAIESEHLSEPFGSFFENIRSYGSGCIMSAAASLEALINEFFIAPSGPLRHLFADFDAEFWGTGRFERKPPLAKYQEALKMLRLPEFEERSPIYKEVDALFQLRNTLVHYKPTWDPDRQTKVSMIEVLSGKYELSPFIDSGADFVTMRSMSASCMNWVVATTLRFMREFHERTHMDDKKMSSFWSLAAP